MISSVSLIDPLCSKYINIVKHTFSKKLLQRKVAICHHLKNQQTWETSLFVVVASVEVPRLVPLSCI